MASGNISRILGGIAELGSVLAFLAMILVWADALRAV